MIERYCTDCLSVWAAQSIVDNMSRQVPAQMIRSRSPMLFASVLSCFTLKVAAFAPSAFRWNQLETRAAAVSGWCRDRGTERIRRAATGNGKGREFIRIDEHERSNDSGMGGPCSRSDMLRSLGLAGSAVLLGQGLPWETRAAMAAPDELPTVGKITKSGVKYFEYRVGSGETPRWGQDCVVRYVMYGRTSPGTKLVKVDASDNNGEPYLFKHGNGRQIKGMEEGMHSMRVGGKRRIVIPRELGYTVQGLGPYPANPRNRDVLVQVLKSFEKSPGELVMDVELLEVFDDEADQGYYEDETPSLEELQQILSDTSRFSGGQRFEKLPGQTAVPLDDDPSAKTSSKSSSSVELPGELEDDSEF